jgi:hypothetical protein
MNFIIFLADPEHAINIPNFIVRGTGNKTHIEFEIRIFFPTDQLLIFRRYKKFRELHLSMCELYHDKVSY